MEEIPQLTEFHLLPEIETPKTFKVHGNNISHNKIIVFAAQDAFGEIYYLN